MVQNQKSWYVAEVMVCHSHSIIVYYNYGWFFGPLVHCMCACAVGDSTGKADPNGCRLSSSRIFFMACFQRLLTPMNCTNFPTTAQLTESLSLTGQTQPAASAAGIAHFTAISWMPPSWKHMPLLILTLHSLYAHTQHPY